VPVSAKAVLHIDDSADDLFLFQKAASQAAVSFRLHLVNSGREGLNYLQGAGEYSDRSKFPVPDLILLDLKMPLPDGFSVLRWIRAQSQFSQITICIFTSSFQHEDIQETYSHGADCFLTKPPAFDRLVGIASAVNQFLTALRIEALKELPEFRR
jgi:CheY-like chemotaxis protein